jgi:hypothetical protein
MQAKPPPPRNEAEMTSAKRTPLPARRLSETAEVRHGETTFTVTIGFDDAGSPREVFADGHKEGSAMRHLLSDACIIISVALQHGVSPDDLRRSLGTTPTFRGDAPASAIGAVMAALAEANNV